MSAPEHYVDREQTLVKHFILQKYLERFAHIVGAFWDSVTYVDCFSGPWNVRSQDLQDSSFAIALDELRKARSTLAAQGRDLKLRCFFLEKDRRAYKMLKEFADQATDAQIETRNCDLEDAVSDVVNFVGQGGSKSFPFVFIDPTGWSGFAMKTIAPLLQFDPGEVLINFMTGHIRRFIESPNEQTQDSFESLFGSGNYKIRVQGLTEGDLDDALVQAYAENVKKTGGFQYACSAIVLHPEIDRTHFHLIYATRHLKGVEVFKDVEKKAMPVMEEARADAQQRKRVKKSQTMELFESEVLYDSTLYGRLRERYLMQGKKSVQQAIQQKGRVAYDEVWILALSLPLVWESDLKAWIADWVRRGELRIDGMKLKQRAPRRGENNFLVWTAPSDPKPPGA
jgi:three-Cys-motif partner protein